MLGKSLDDIQYRHLNEAFDALIDEANANYEKENNLNILDDLDFDN
jgi:hypothetical protein